MKRDVALSMFPDVVAEKVDGVDFTSLPEPPASFDTVCFDPPYVISGDLIRGGLGEAIRVARSFVLVKCMEFAQGSRMAGSDFHDMPHLVTKWALELGWVKHDLIVHDTGTGPGGHNIFTVKRARRAHSYLLVFTP